MIDLHTHTNKSDGRDSPAELIRQAKAAGIKVLSITDHNMAVEDLPKLQQSNPEIILIQGAEISCLYNDSLGIDHEVHIIALGFDPHHEKINKVLCRNQINRRPYVNAILTRLQACGINLGTYDDIAKAFPETKYIGRMAIAKLLVKGGYCETVDAAFDMYLGAFGQRKAYVNQLLRYIPMEELIAAIIEAKALPILCHLKYYQLGSEEEERLVQYYKQILCHYPGGLEVSYARYSADVQQYCADLCRKYDLLPSVGSDYHGAERWETLLNRFPIEGCREILGFLGIDISAIIL